MLIPINEMRSIFFFEVVQLLLVFFYFSTYFPIILTFALKDMYLGKYPHSLTHWQGKWRLRINIRILNKEKSTL